MFNFHDGVGSATVTPELSDGVSFRPVDQLVVFRIACGPSYFPLWALVPYVDLRFGTTNPPEIVLRGIGAQLGWRAATEFSSGDGPGFIFRYDPGPLIPNTVYFWQVSVRNGWTGCNSGPVWTFNTNVPPGMPSAPNPADTATTRTFTLTWAAAADATAYDVKFGTSNPPTTIVSADQPGTSYAATVTSAIPYYWQIIAKNVYGSTPGPVWSFLAAAPLAPSGPSPVDTGATPLAPTLTWSAAVGAVSYDVYFSTSTPPVTLVSAAQVGTSYTPTPPLVTGTTYYWQIRANNAAGSTTGPIWSFAATEDWMTTLTTTTTGTVDNFNFGALTNLTMLRCNNASLLTIDGITNNGSAPSDGQLLWIESIGAGQVDIANQNAGSTAANRVINNVTATISLAAGVGRALLWYDGTTARWRVLEHEQGTWIVVPFTAGDFTASANTWTVAAGDLSLFRYWLKGRSLTVALNAITTTLSGTAARVYVLVPGGFLIAANAQAPAGFCINAGAAFEPCYVDLATSLNTKIQYARQVLTSWTASTDNLGLYTTTTFEVQ